MYIKDLTTGLVREYGTSRHDSLIIEGNGRFLTYENLQNGDGSRYGEYRFVTSEKGETPNEDKDLITDGTGAYFNIGGFKPSETYTTGHNENETYAVEDNSIFSVMRSAIKKYGAIEQTVVAVEELAELQKELCKQVRAVKGHGKADHDALVEEMADAEIMLMQMQLCWDVSYDAVVKKQAEKIARLHERIMNELPD